MIGIMTPYLDYVYAIDLPNRDRTLAKEELCEVLAKYGICAEQAVHIEQALVQAKNEREKMVWYLHLVPYPILEK